MERYAVTIRPLEYSSIMSIKVSRTLQTHEQKINPSSHPELGKIGFLGSISISRYLDIELYVLDNINIPLTPYSIPISISRYLDIDLDLLFNINILPKVLDKIKSISRYLDFEFDFLININILPIPYSIPISISRYLDIDWDLLFNIKSRSCQDHVNIKANNFEVK